MVVIAISGMPGCGSSTTARLLAKRLKLRLFIAGDYFKSFESGKETARAVKFFKTKKGSSKDFHTSLDDISRQKALEGNAVIEGKLALRMLKDIADYKIWLTTSKDVRIQRYIKRDNVTQEEAQKLLEEKEKLEKESFQRIYKFNLYDQEKEADLVINTRNKKPEEIVDTIINALKDAKIIE